MASHRPSDTENAVIRELARLYVADRQSLAAIGQRFGHSPDWVKARLLRAGVTIRPGGTSRILRDDPVRELLDRGLRTAQIAEELGCSQWAVLQVMRRNGWQGPVRRPRGRTKSLPALPDRDVLLTIATPDQLDPKLVAAELGISLYQAKEALQEAGLTRPRGTNGRSAPAVDLDLVREMYEQRTLTVAEIARRLGSSSGRVRGALNRAGVPRRPITPAPITAGHLRDLYDRQRLDDRAIGAILNVPAYRVRLRRKELGVRRTTLPPRPAVPPHEAQQMAALYRSGKTLAQIARAHHTRAPRVRQILADQSVLIKPRTAREHRKVPDPLRLRELYEIRGWTAPEIAAAYDISRNLVLRTLHDHRVPVHSVRQSSRPRYRRSPMVRLKELYADPEITALLGKYGLPTRRRRGSLAERFSTPLPVPDAFLVMAYREIGLAAAHIEMLTGNPADHIRRELRRLGVQIRPSGKSPWLRRQLELDPPD